MHMTVDYTNLAKPEVKALADCKEWLGADRFAHLTSLFKSDYPGITLDQFRVMVSFAGIQGYPCKVWYEHIYS